MTAFLDAGSRLAAGLWQSGAVALTIGVGCVFAAYFLIANAHRLPSGKRYLAPWQQPRPNPLMQAWERDGREPGEMPGGGL